MTNYLNIVLIFFFQIPFCLISCTQTKKIEREPIISKVEFINLYSESLSLKYSPLKQDKLDSALIAIYQRYNLTKKKYDQIETYYKANPNEWIEILKEVDKKIQILSEQSQKTVK